MDRIGCRQDGATPAEQEEPFQQLEVCLLAVPAHDVQAGVGFERRKMSEASQDMTVVKLGGR